MSKFLEVTVVDEGDEWLMSVRLGAIQAFERMGEGTVVITFEGGARRYAKIGYEELKGILEGEGEGKRWSILDQDEDEVCPKCDREMPCDCPESEERCHKCGNVHAVGFICLESLTGGMSANDLLDGPEVTIHGKQCGNCGSEYLTPSADGFCPACGWSRDHAE